MFAFAMIFCSRYLPIEMVLITTIKYNLIIMLLACEPFHIIHNTEKQFVVYFISLPFSCQLYLYHVISERYLAFGCYMIGKV